MTSCVPTVLALLAFGCASDPVASRSGALTDRTVYVHCDWNPDTAQIDDTNGDDANPGTWALPKRTIGAVAPPADGERLIVQLCGWGGSDPCVEPAERRACRTSRLHIYGSEAFLNTHVIRGPRRMFPVTPLLTYASASASGSLTGRSVRISFASPTLIANDHAGRFLRVTREDGREVFFPQAVAANDTTSITVDADLTAADWAADRIATDRFHVVVPAVEIMHPENPSRGVLVTGFGATHVGDVESPVWDATIERVGFYRPRFHADGLTLENVMVTGGGEMRGDSARHRQVAVRLPGGYVVTGSSSAQGAGSSFTLYQEPVGRSLATNDPEVRFNGQDLTVIGPLFIGDYNLGVADGKLRVHKSLSVRAVPWDVDGAVNVLGGGSELLVTDHGYLFVEHTAALGVGLWVKNCGMARVRATDHVDVFGAAGGFARVGWAEAVTRAAFLAGPPTGWGGLLMRSDGDCSRVVDKTAEDSVGAPYYSTNGSGGQG